MLEFKLRIKMRRLLNGISVAKTPETNRNDMGVQAEPNKGNYCPRLQHKGFQKAHRIGLSVLAAVIVGSMNACTYKSPAVEEPVPVEADIPKSFFVTASTDAKGKVTSTPKKFLCGWASEMEVGYTAEWFYTNNAIVPEHCNVVFEITERKLVAKLINPSFPNEPSRWAIAFTIPISSHHYTEREKDGSGRETNKVVRNTSRSHWSARPSMQLDLAGINLEGQYSSIESWWGLRNMGNISVDKVEWDMKNGFLGFTMQKGTSDGHYARIRFNIKEFETNTAFKTTPFNDTNYKKMNVLHIIGEKANGVYPILKAAHWDTNKKIEIKLWEVPEKYVPMMEEIVSDWNEALRKAEATTLSEGPFVISKEPAKYAFDLRYPTIAWVADEKISNYSPLGIGIALTDVSNGEIKWGMITLYTGYIEKYMKSFLQTSDAQKAGSSNKISASVTASMKLPTSLELPALMSQFKQVTQDQVSSLVGYFMSKEGTNSKKGHDIKADRDMQEAKFALHSGNMKKYLDEISGLAAAQIQETNRMSKGQTSEKNMEHMLRNVIMKGYNTAEAEMNPDGSMKKPAILNRQEFENELRKKYSSPVACTERVFADVMPGWAAAMGKTTESAGNLGNDDKVLWNLIKELTTHEFGHFVGLGHQFKENILPERGSVPDSMYQPLAEKATAEKNYTNYTSVMGYRSPRVELNEKGEIKPGPQDVLVLRFLYKQQYATYKKKDAQFTFQDIPADGVIPEHNPTNQEYKTTYFPQCNDLQASLSIDPFCNRFDIGPNAKVIVKSYFEDLTANLIPTLIAFTDARGGNVEAAEARLWYRSLNNIGRVRVFYDYMRLFFKPQFEEIKADEKALLQFSSACQQKTEDIKHPVLKRIFGKHPELKDLCQANGIALNEMKSLITLNAADFSKMNFKNQFIPGGMSGGDASRDWSRIFGSWEELSAFPLKYSALYGLTTAIPWINFGSNMYSHFYYGSPGESYSYMYLYPQEYVKIMAANVAKNLKFKSLGQGERTRMGRSVMAMTWMNYWSKIESSDSGIFPKAYRDKIRKELDFRLGFVAVILKGVPREDGSQMHMVRWDGMVYDFAIGKNKPINSAYILPGGTVIASAPDVFLYPVTQFTPLSENEGYYFAYKIDYTRDSSSEFSDIGIKTDLKMIHDKLYDLCIDGDKKNEYGLAKFFTTEEKKFEGFEMGPTIERSPEKQDAFKSSINKAFSEYTKLNPDGVNNCQEALSGIGLIITAAGSIGGYWLPEVYDYIH
jgi:hypothetical protein